VIKNVFLSDFNETIFVGRFSKNFQIPNFMKIHRVAAEFFHSDGRKNGQTDMTKLILAFHNFANNPNNFRDIVKILKYRAVGST
jgi:hypothetical protein